MLRYALVALAPPTEPGVWLKAPPRPGTVVTAPLDVTGETQALEGVLRVELFEVRGSVVRLVSTYRPTLPVGTVPFTFRWAPSTPGTVTIRVVATTLARGFSAEAAGLVVPAAPRAVAVHQPAAPAAPAPRAVPAPRVATRASRSIAVPRVDDSGTAFGATAPLLPYAPVNVTPPVAQVATVAAPERVPPERSGWASVAAGLLLIVTCSHLHRVLRSQPDPRDGR